jgi:predicted RNA binding protein YcfA (HicA-like mRNA interferase family)
LRRKRANPGYFPISSLRYDYEVKFRDIIKMVEVDGWRISTQRGSHRQYKHPSKSGKVTIAGHPSVEAAPKTLKSILEQAGLKP